jgi:hypothetical protein
VTICPNKPAKTEIIGKSLSILGLIPGFMSITTTKMVKESKKERITQLEGTG